MLTIRDAQFDGFRRAEWRSFLQGIEKEARATLASRGDPRAAAKLEEAVADAVRLAQYHGFRSRPAMISFARLLAVAGPGWRTPAVEAVLSDETSTAEIKLARLTAAIGF